MRDIAIFKRTTSKAYEVDPLSGRYLYETQVALEDALPSNVVLEAPPSNLIEAMWDFQGKMWYEGRDTDKILEDKRNEKISELNKRCNETILGRFSHEINGKVYYFSNDMEAQANFEKCDRSFEQGRITDVVWTTYDIDGNVVRIVLTPEIFELVYISHLEHIQSNIAKFRDFLMPLVLEADTIEEIEAIKW